MMHNRGSNHEVENVDYDRQLQENTRQAAAEFAAITTTTVLHYDPGTTFQPKLNINQQQVHNFQRSTGIHVPPGTCTQGNELSTNTHFENYDCASGDGAIDISGKCISNNLKRSGVSSKYILAKPTNSKEKLVNAIKSVLDASNCEEPSSFPSFSGSYSHNGSQVYTEYEQEFETCNVNADGNECFVRERLHDVNENSRDSVDQNVNVDCNIAEDNHEVPNDGNNSEDEQNIIGCKNCENIRKEFNEWKKQMLANFQIMKLKVMSTDELISEHHKNFAVLENEKKLVKDLQAKLEACYGETGALRIQLKKALQANEPLKKTVRRFEYEKSLKQQTIDELKLKLDKIEMEMGNLKGISNSSRCLQEEYKKTIEDNGKEHDKDKKKIIQQAKLIDKLNASLTASKKKQSEQNKTLRKALKDNEKMCNNKSISYQSKTMKKNLKLENISPGKASKKSPIGVLSPSPSPPPTNVCRRRKHTKEAEGKDNTKDKHFFNVSQRSADRLSSTSGNDTDDEMEELLANSPGSPSTTHFSIPTLLSPPLSPIPPSPIPDFTQEIKATNRYAPLGNIKSVEVNDSLDTSANSYNCTSLFGDISQSDDENEQTAPNENPNITIEESDRNVSVGICNNDDNKNQGISIDSQTKSDEKEVTLVNTDPYPKDLVKRRCREIGYDYSVNETIVLSQESSREDVLLKPVDESERKGDEDEDDGQIKKANERSMFPVPSVLGKAVLFPAEATTNSPSRISRISVPSKTETVVGEQTTSQQNIVEVSEIQTNDNIAASLSPRRNSLLVDEKVDVLQSPINSDTNKTDSEIKDVNTNCKSEVKKKRHNLKSNNLVSGKKRKSKGVDIFVWSISRNTRNAKYRQKPSMNESTNETQSVLEDTVCVGAHNSSPDNCSPEKTAVDFQINVNTATLPSNICVDSKDIVPDKQSLNNSIKEMADDKNATVDLNKENNILTTDMDTNDEVNVTDSQNSICDTSLFSTTCSNNITSINHIDSNTTSASMPISSDPIKPCQTSPSEEFKNHLIVNVTSCKTNIASTKIVVSESQPVLDNKPSCGSTETFNILEKLPDNNSSKYSISTTTTSDGNSDKSTADELDSEVASFQLPVQHPILSNIETSTTSGVKIHEIQDITSVSNHLNICNPVITLSGKSSVRVIKDVSKNISTVQMDNECSRKNDEKVNNYMKDLRSHMDETDTSEHIVVDGENGGNVVDDLDSEVASFKLPVQCSLPLNTAGSSSQSTDDLALSTSKVCENQNVETSMSTIAANANKSLRSIDNSVAISRFTVANSCQCSTVSTSINSMLWSYPSRARHVVGGRHSMYSTSGVDTIPTFLASRLRVERTRSLSPTLFSPPSPPLSPIPPSPRRSILTPIISPLPTTPLPESVSPLPPSPKITSPPLIRGSALLLTDDPSIFVPKPVSHSTSSAVKVLKFTKSENIKDFQNNRRKEETSNVRRSILESMRARSCSPSCLPRKSSNISKVSTNTSDVIASSNILLNEDHYIGNSRLPSISVDHESSGGSTCNLHKSITKVSCYPYNSEEQPNSLFASCLTDQADSTSVSHEKSRIFISQKKDSTKDVKTSNTSTQGGDVMNKPCSQSNNTKLSNIERRIKAMKHKSNVKYIDKKIIAVDNTDSKVKRCGNYLELDLNSLPSKRHTTTYYSSSTITKPVKEVEKTKCSVDTTPSCFAFTTKQSCPTVDSKHKINTCTTIKASSSNVWRHFDDKIEKQISSSEKTKKEIRNDILSELSSDDDCLHIVSESCVNQDENCVNQDVSDNNIDLIQPSCSYRQSSDISDIETNAVINNKNIKKHSTKIMKKNLPVQTSSDEGCLHILTESCSSQDENDCKIDNSSSNVSDKLPSNDTDKNISMMKNNEQVSNDISVQMDNTRCSIGNTNLLKRKIDKKTEIQKLDTKVDQISPPKKQIIKDKENCESDIKTDRDQIDCEQVHSVRVSSISEEGEYESNDDMEVEIHELILKNPDTEIDLLVTESVGESTSKDMKNKSLHESKTSSEKLMSSTELDMLQIFTKFKSSKSVKMRSKQSELGYMKKLFRDFQDKTINKKDVIVMLCKPSNCTSIKHLSTALITTIQNCEETLLPKILKNLENNTTSCTCTMNSTRCTGCDNIECICEKNVETVECPQCKKLRSTCTTTDKQNNRNTEYIHPVLTTFEKDILTILVAVLKLRNFPLSVRILLDDLQTKIHSNEDMLTCERLALCRIFVSVCRIFKKTDRLFEFLFSIGYDQFPHISFPMIYITCYSIWPSFMLRTTDFHERTRLVIQHNKTLNITLNNIKLTPLSCILQFLALVESVERKEPISQKILERLLSIKWSNEFSSSDYYKQFIEELVTLLSDRELSFVKRSDENEIELCSFVFSTIKAVEILCKRLGWEWTYNELIVERIWNMIKAYFSGSTDIHADTVAIFIRLSGDICQYGVTIGYDLREYCQLLLNVLCKTMDSETVLDSIEISIVYTILVMAPAYVDMCYSILKSWLDQAGERDLIVPTVLSAAISDIFL